MIIQSKHFVVTGAASGLGLATVERLVADGAKVSGFDINEQALAELSERFPGSVKGFSCDVCDEGSVNNALDMAEAFAGEVRGVVNCAGIIGAAKLVGRKGPYELQAFQRVIDINLLGTVNVMRLAAARMTNYEPLMDGERGVVINTASVAAFDGQKGQTAYSASKGAIVSLALPAARDLASVGIRVNTVAPGVMATPMLMEADEKVLAPLLAVTQFPKRLGAPAEFADAVAFLIGNRLMNGATLRIDGAMRLP
ncbi:SDR family NAD(P)-dependent oxidoreductase [Umboniibacter marinipuniceus]|uniref:NAD(P)-dependent dehydrogenase (Short-subunit alcohol dehydrogenase family) n=1 Tax=Umboniibacter marinipuniceus TaxID=569599 RepID=A0A3M0AQR6_9GAMM|nr:SDR family NAD(P)-dependent oxidoreductase [Umboniibacter marinipuniceus]RMA81342.1 NAD(P)-dependent dehydrogenase (short-subunit alcohol dehydrogenase family) [Umboniibacter marinipuniceus]